MIYTDEAQDEIKSTTASEAVTITVPDRVVDAIAARLDVLEDPDEADARDIAFDHVEMSHRLVTPDGELVERAALDRADGGLELEYDEDDVASSSADEETPEPIEVGASAQLDYADDPTRPLSIDVAIPAGVIDEDDLDGVLESVSIDARIVDE